MKTSWALASVLYGISTVSAHSIFQELYVNGVSQGRLNGIRVPDYDGPITDVTSNDVICNGGINPYHTPISTTVIPVAAGTQVTAVFHHTLTSEFGTDSADPIDPSHNGPILAYLAQVPSATQTNVAGLKWFKIYHDGLDSNGWAVQRLIANQGKVTFTIPGCIPAGQYLLRVELIALHGASSYPGAQLYMECAQLEITGGGSTSPATVSFPGAYAGTDPGITFNLYAGATTYTIPGPSVFSCDGSSTPVTTTSTTSTSATTKSTTSTTTTKSTTSTTTTKSSSTSTSTTSSASSTTTSTSGTVAHWGQCGGTGYTGATACISPYTCVVSNDWYSQCL